jgi:hypothetical protein
MGAVLFHSDHIIDTDMGIREETTTHSGGIQHHLGMDLLHGASTAFDINISMSEQYLLPMARNSVTGQTVKNQDLTGAKFTQRQRVLAEDMAHKLADRMTARTGDAWQGFVHLYTPTHRS